MWAHAKLLYCIGNLGGKYSNAVSEIMHDFNPCKIMLKKYFYFYTYLLSVLTFMFMFCLSFYFDV